jgi:hypothetical protein
MASFNETRILLEIELRRLANGSNRVWLVVKTFDDVRDRASIRTYRQDVTSLMSQARLDGIDALLDDALAYAKQQLELPVDVAVGWPDDPQE